MMKPLCMTFARCNPPGVQHEHLIKAIIKSAGVDMDHRIYLSPTQDGNKNPLDYETKLWYMRKAFPYANIVETPEVKNMFDALYHARDLGYKDVRLFVGHDRFQKMVEQTFRYAFLAPEDKGFNFDFYDVIGIEQLVYPTYKEKISARVTRQYARDNNFPMFSLYLPGGLNSYLRYRLFDDVRKGLGIETECINNYACTPFTDTLKSPMENPT